VLILYYTRKPSIIQYQITDFIFTPVQKVFKMNEDVEYRKAMKAIHTVPRRKPQKRGRKKDMTKLFYKIDHFIKKGNLTSTSPIYLLRFRKIPVVPLEDIEYEGITSYEKLMLKALPGFTGFFDEVILCNNFTYFDDLQLALEKEGISFRGRSLHDIIIYELARIQIGIDTYTSFANAVRFFQPLFPNGILHDPNYFPDVDLVSHVLRALPLEMLQEYFFMLLDEMYEDKITKNRILIWDGQFVHSNSSDHFNKEKGSYNDPDAGFCRHQNKIYGVGYKVSTIYAYSGDRTIPVYCELFPGNRDEYSVLHDTFDHFFSKGYEMPSVILADAGPYSLENLYYFFDQGIIPLINSKSSIKNHNVMTLNDSYCLNMDFIPEEWTREELISLMNIRTEIERQFSHNIVVYHARRANVRGWEMVSKHRYLILILDLLKILTAYKLGRPDLIGKARIFSMSKGVDFYRFFPHLAKEAGFDIFFPHMQVAPTFFQKG